MTIEQTIQLLKALSPYAWPLLAVIAFLRLLPTIKAFLSRENVKFKFGDMEVSGEQAAQSLIAQVKDLQDKVVQLEEKMDGEKGLRSEDTPPLVALSIIRGNKPRILWVDDVPGNNAIQIQKLMQDGYWVDVALTTAKALSMFEVTKYDLVISDMGRLEEGAHRPYAGITLAQELRRQNSTIPIIIFTTHQNVARFQEGATEAGALKVTNSTIDLYQTIDGLFPKGRNAN